MSGRPGASRPIPDALAGFLEASAGAWRLVAPREHLQEARALLGPMDVEEMIHALSRAGTPGDSPSRGGHLEVESGGGSGFVVKALRRGGLPGRLRGGYYGRRRLQREMAVHKAARDRGAPIPGILFGAWGRRRDGTEIALLATERIEEARTLADLVREPEQGSGSREACRELLRRAGEAVRRLHDAGVEHADLNVGNILLGAGGPGGSPEARVIDLGLSSLGPPLVAGRRASNLVRLLRSAEKHLGRGGTRLRDAAAFLQGYLRAGDPDRRARAELLRAVRRRLPALVLHRLGWSISRRSR